MPEITGEDQEFKFDLTDKIMMNHITLRAASNNKSRDKYFRKFFKFSILF